MKGRLVRLTFTGEYDKRGDPFYSFPPNVLPHPIPKSVRLRIIKEVY